MDEPSSPDDLVPEPVPSSEPAADEERARRMSPRTRAWIGMGAVLVALVLLMMLPGPGGELEAPPPAADGTSAAGDEERAVVGKAAQLQFTLKDMNGVNVNLASFKGKVLLINFWATWCGPCRVEIPYLIELQNQYADDLVVLGVSVDDPAEKLKPYANEMKVNYPMLVGNGRQDFQDAYGPFWGIPVTVFVDREGNIHKKHSGIASKEQFEHEIKSML